MPRLAHAKGPRGIHCRVLFSSIVWGKLSKFEKANVYSTHSWVSFWETSWHWSVSLGPEQVSSYESGPFSLSIPRRWLQVTEKVRETCPDHGDKTVQSWDLTLCITEGVLLTLTFVWGLLHVPGVAEHIYNASTEEVVRDRSLEPIGEPALWNQWASGSVRDLVSKTELGNHGGFPTLIFSLYTQAHIDTHVPRYTWLHTHMNMNVYMNMYTHTVTQRSGEKGKKRGEIIKDYLNAGGPPPCTAGVSVGHLGTQIYNLLIVETSE